MNRPAYIERKVALERARREAIRTHAQPCACAFCITHEQVQAVFKARTDAERERIGEAPF